MKLVRRPRLTRRRIFAALGAAAVLALALPGGARADAAAATPVTLNGGGTWDPQAELNSWYDGLYSATDSMVNNSYIPQGDQIGVQDFVDGSSDYVISGVPLQASQLSQLSGGASDVIAAPIMPSGLQILFAPPSGGFAVYKVDDEGNVTVVPYGPPGDSAADAPLANCPPTGTPATPTLSEPTAACPPVNVPASNLVYMLEGLPGPDSADPADYWGNADILASWDQSVLDYDPTEGDEFNSQPATGIPFVELRTDPNDENYYLEQWAATEAPSAWSYSSTPSETLPPTYGVWTKVGLEEELDDFATDVNGLTGSVPTGGFLTEAPPSGKYLVEQAEIANEKAYAVQNPTAAPLLQTVPENVQLENADGQWESPTPAAIDAGVDAGATAGRSACASTNNDALYAMTKDVSGAYPVSWVDCLYAPAKGLSMAKANALAGLVRYLVTDGQQQLEPDGDGVLPSTYVDQALAAANTIVTDNCPGAGGTVVLTATAPTYEPVSAGVKALGAVDECEAKPAVTTTASTSTTVAKTTTTSTSTTTTTVAVVPGSTSSGSATSQAETGTTSTTTVPVHQAVASPAAPTKPLDVTTKPATGGSAELAASVAANLPNPLSPSSNQSIDKLSALVLGGLFFLLGRRIVRWAVKAWAR